MNTWPHRSCPGQTILPYTNYRQSEHLGFLVFADGSLTVFISIHYPIRRTAHPSSGQDHCTACRLFKRPSTITPMGRWPTECSDDSISARFPVWRYPVWLQCRTPPIDPYVARCVFQRIWVHQPLDWTMGRWTNVIATTHGKGQQMIKQGKCNGREWGFPWVECTMMSSSESLYIKRCIVSGRREAATGPALI